MKTTLSLFLLLVAGNISAQEVISTQGESYSNSNGSIDFTIGEVVINTGTDGTNDLTQGFHQTNWNFVGLEDHQPNYTVKVFPNPLQNELIIEAPVYDGVSYVLTDALGRIIQTGALSSIQTSVPTQELATGSYQLQLLNKETPLKTIKLSKNQ